MKIIVSEKNRKRLQAALDEAQQGKRARLLDVDNILWMGEILDRRFHFASADMVGVVADVDLFVRRGGIYGSPMGTHAVLERVASGWALTKLYRGYCRGVTAMVEAYVPEAARDRILRDGYISFSV